MDARHHWYDFNSLLSLILMYPEILDGCPFSTNILLYHFVRVSALKQVESCNYIRFDVIKYFQIQFCSLHKEVLLTCYCYLGNQL